MLIFRDQIKEYWDNFMIPPSYWYKENGIVKIISNKNHVVYCSMQWYEVD